MEGRHGTIVGYKIKYHLDEAVEGNEIEVKVSSSKSTTLHGLRRWANYSISTLASTVAGDGIYSKPLICGTDEDGMFQIWIQHL